MRSGAQYPVIGGCDAYSTGSNGSLMVTKTPLDCGIALDPVARIPEFKVCAVSIERFSQYFTS